MRHRQSGKKFNRNTSQRKALFKNLIQSLIIHEEIKTTEAKAKAIKRLVAKLITKAKAGTLHARRQILAFLPDKKAANKLFDETALRFKKRTSGFTRLVRLGKRRGDDAMMVKLELTEKKKEVKGSKGRK
jgi:large subunit ribosomal protein L17